VNSFHLTVAYGKAIVPELAPHGAVLKAIYFRNYCQGVFEDADIWNYTVSLSSVNTNDAGYLAVTLQ